MNKLYVAVMFLIGLSSFNVSAQQISGKISDSSNLPVPGATVRLRPLGLVTISDLEGNYYFPQVQEGRYSLSVSFIGYTNEQQQVTLVGNQDLVLNFSLNVSENELQTVEVFGRKETSYKNGESFSASKIEMKVKDIPQTISSVTKELIQDQQSLRLQEVVKNVAGVNQFSMYDDITMRGFRNSGNNGRLINGLRGINNFWTSPLLVNIERVEFIKGPASAVFANASPGGTINMITKKPLQESRQSIQFTTGSFNTFRTQADFTGAVNQDKTFLYRLNIGYENSDTFRDQINNNSIIVAPSVSFVPKDGTRFNADLVYSSLNTKLDRGRTIVQGTRDVFATPSNFNIAQPGDFLNQQNLALTLSFSQEIIKNLTFNASYLKVQFDEQLQEHGFNGYITPDSISMYFTDRITDQSGNNLSTYLNFKVNSGKVSHNLLAGFDYIDGGYVSNDRFADGLPDGVANISLTNLQHLRRPTESYFFQDANTYNYGDKYYTRGVYIQDLIEWNRFKFLVSLRQEFYTFPKADVTGDINVDITEEKKQNAFLPRIGVTYAATKNINVYGTYASGFEPQEGYIIGNPNFGGPFDPLTSSLYEAGAKGEFFDNRLFFGASVYQITQNNVLVNANNPSNPDLLVQRGQEQATGFELEAAGNILPNLSVSSSYANNNAIITESSEGDPNNQVGLVKENAPRHISGSWIKYGIDKGLFNGLGFAIGHSQVSSRETFDRNLQLPSYLIFNAALYYQVERFQIGINLNNLTDKEHLIGGYNFQRNFPGAPRNYLLKIAYNL